ncbi:MAG: hypothetical protein ACI9HY_001339 [Planctomycetaceae bacterium]|jgi:hypothetical protein
MTRRRAHSLKEHGELIQKAFAPQQGAPKPDALQIRSSDIVITPFAKSGTTWLQQMVHTLRTGGDMDFDDISRVVPWVENSSMLGLDINAEQRANPRAFKSHLTYEELPPGGRYINSVRDPRDALFSMFKFMEGWFIEPGTVPLEEFALQFIDRGGYWKHLLSWWNVRNENFVLFLCYETMQTEIDLSIERVAEFIDVPLTAKLKAITLKHTSIDFMKQHKDRFDDAMMRKMSEERAGIPVGSDSSKVREGRVGDHKENLSPAIINALDKVWQKEITPITGCKNYEKLQEKLKAGMEGSAE